MALLTESYLREKAQIASGYSSDHFVRASAVTALAANAKQASESGQIYDIFLSHALEDAILIRGLHDELIAVGYSVYVDWIEDPEL
ncbi:MAG TPA: hypothetical protein VN625_07670, partial [Desulfuromonadaceae bacterium]|nr:hypothetical protein [Desulfuromonadaceae bacterium]